jgi:DNA replication licensing factor MCM5
MPSVSVDLEHLIMPHWTSNTEIATLASDKEDVDSLDEQRDEDFMSNRKDWGGMLVFALRQQPLHFLKLAEQCVREVYLELFGFDTRSGSALSVAQQCEPLSLFQVELISRQRPTRIGDLAATDVETLVTVPGIVVQASRPQHKALKVKIKCRQCEHEQFLYIPLWRETVEFPRVCGAKGGRSGNPAEPRCPLDPYIIVSDESEFCDIQTIKIQELPEQVFGGDMPHHVTVHAANALCGRVAPGHRILVAGVYSIQHKSNSLAQNINDESVQTAYLYALGISRMDATTRSLTKSMMKGSNPWTFQQEEEFQKMARNTTIHQQIFDSIAPSIFGLEDIKKSIACLLFGGSMKKLPDGSRLRGDINILLLGDPSTAKSQFLKFVERVAPIAVYTSGKGSSAAGLTAAVIRDSNRNFALEGGAMVLADGGVVCIDEFDKMRDDDRVAIHEAMEQQTISIAKAGITTVLTTRCSVLAAANPSFGSYDDFKETIEQHNFETTILSRYVYKKLLFS